MRQNHKMVKHSQTIRRTLPRNSLSVFGNFVGLALKGLTYITPTLHSHRNQPIDLHYKSINWFLNEGNIELM